MKKSIIYSISYTCLLATIFCFLACKKSEKKVVNIFFDNVENAYVNAISEILSSSGEKDEITFIFEKEMKDENHKMEECLLFSTGLSNENTEVSLPLLVEPFYLLANKNVLRENSSSLLQTIDEFASLLTKSNKRFPILLSGSDDETLLFFLSSIMFMTEDTGALDLDEVRDPSKWKNNPVFKRVIEWQTQGFFYPEWFRLTCTDVEAFMENEDIAFAFIKNSDLVKISKEVQDLYSVISLQSFDKKVSSPQFAKVISLVSLKDGKSLKVDKKTSTIKKLLTLLNEKKETDELLKREGLLRMSDLERKDDTYPNHLLVYNVFAKDADKAMISEMRQYFHVGGFGY